MYELLNSCVICMLVSHSMWNNDCVIFITYVFNQAITTAITM